MCCTRQSIIQLSSLRRSDYYIVWNVLSHALHITEYIKKHANRNGNYLLRIITPRLSMSDNTISAFELFRLEITEKNERSFMFITYFCVSLTDCLQMVSPEGKPFRKCVRSRRDCLKDRKYRTFQWEKDKLQAIPFRQIKPKIYLHLFNETGLPPLRMQFVDAVTAWFVSSGPYPFMYIIRTVQGNFSN